MQNNNDDVIELISDLVVIRKVISEIQNEISDICVDISKAIKKYDEKNLLIDAMYWSQVLNRLKKLL